MDERKPIRVLLTIEGLGSGGRERRLTELVKALLLTKRFELYLVLLKPVIFYELPKSELLHIHIVKSRPKRWALRLFYDCFKFGLGSSPQLIHVWGNKAGFFFIPYAKFFGIPIINSFIGDVTAQSAIALSTKINFKYAAIVTSNSQAGLTSYKVSLNKSRVVYNGFDLNRVTELKTERWLCSNPSVKLVGIVARKHPLKDHATFFKAMSLLLGQRDDVEVVVVGEGNFQEFLELINPEHKKRFHILEAQPNVFPIIAQLDIGVLSSKSEGLPNFLLECMAFAKPVVATSVGGIPELVVDGETGILVPSTDHVGLFEGILRLVENDDLRRKMGDKGFERVKSKFDMSKMSEEFIHLYMSALKD